MRQSIRAAMVFCVSLGITPLAHAQEYTFTTIDVP